MEKQENPSFWKKRKWIIFVCIAPFILAGIFFIISILTTLTNNGELGRTIENLAEQILVYSLWLVPIFILIRITIHFIIKRKTFAWLTSLAISLFTWIPLLLKWTGKLIFPRGYIISSQITNLIQDSIIYTAVIFFFLWPIFLAVSLIKYIPKIKQSKLWITLIIILTVLTVIAEAAFLTIAYIGALAG